MSVLTSSQLTFCDLKDSYNIQVTPDCVAIDCDSSGATRSSSTIIINFGTYFGATRVGSSCSVSNIPGGITATNIVAATNSLDGSVQLNIASGATLGGPAVSTCKLTITTSNSDSFVFDRYITFIKSVTGETGEPGETSIIFNIYSPDGNVFYNQYGDITLYTYAYNGLTSIENGAYQWAKYTSSWSDINGATSSSLTINGEDVLNTQVYKCTMTYNGSTYDSYITLTNFFDLYRSEVKTIGGNVIKNYQNYIVAYAELYKNENVEDGLLGDIGEDYPIDPSNGDYYYKIDSNEKTVSLMKYTSEWEPATEHQVYTYLWKNVIAGQNNSNINMSGKVIVLSSQNICGSTTIECDITNNDSIKIASCQTVCTDVNDPYVGNEPSYPHDGQMWIDTSTNPYTIKFWNVNHNAWELSKAYSNINMFLEKPFNYKKNDQWVVGQDFNGNTSQFIVGTLLTAKNNNNSYSDDDWVDLLSFKNDINTLQENQNKILNHIEVDDHGRLNLIGTLVNGAAKFKSILSSDDLGFYEIDSGDLEKVVWIGNKSLHAKNTEIEGSLSVNYIDGTTTNPSIKIGNFTLQVESNGSLSLI